MYRGAKTKNYLRNIEIKYLNLGKELFLGIKRENVLKRSV